ncbi:MAG: VPDSG-CTERM sorting domain-containing protein [Opitutaceae bacterium]|nr:VPDSG-CTERM sorting domain-containing protein [Opitutaceae bacterium]
MKTYKILLVSAALVSSSFAATAIQSPVAVTGSTLGDNVDAPLSSIVDGSGLSNPFSSGSTSFGGYFASDPQHQFDSGFYTSPMTYLGEIHLDMGMNVLASAFAIWFDPLAPLTSFALYGSLNADFSDSSLLTQNDSPWATPNWADDFSSYTYGATSSTFGPKLVRYLKLEVAGVAPAPDGLASLTIGEVAVGVEKPSTNVPDSTSTLALLGAGLSLVCLLRRRS